MSADAAALPAPLRDAPPSLALLTLIELRKSADTRAGRWMLGIIAVGLLAATVGFVLAAPAAERSLNELFLVLQAPTGMLLPVLAILLVTSEWSQRSALTTFTLVPNRSRVVLAKASATALLGLAAVALALVLALVGTLAWGADGRWALGADVVGEVVVMQLVGVLGGFAFGLAFQSSAPAIVLYFVMPTLLSVVVEIVDAVEPTLRWIDLGQTTLPLGEGTVSATEWARIGTSLVVWLLVPLAIGLWRLERSEIK